MPKGQGLPPTILETLEDRDDLSLFVELLERSGLRDYLEEGARTDMHEYFDRETESTVFAPKNVAFEQLEEVTWDELVDPSNREALRRLMRRHVVAGRLPRRQFADRKIETLGGWRAPLRVEGEKTWFAGALVTRADIECRDGLIHRITGVALDGGAFQSPRESVQ